MSTTDAGQAGPRATHSLRLTFAYSGSDIRLARVQRLFMRALAPSSPPPEGERSGHWIEVRGEADEVLYHRPLHDPLQEDAEVFGDEPGEPLYRVPSEQQEGEFEVIVPDVPGAATVALFGTVRGAKARRRRPKPSTEMLRHSFDELRRIEGGSPDDRETG